MVRWLCYQGVRKVRFDCTLAAIVQSSLMIKFMFLILNIYVNQ